MHIFPRLPPRRIAGCLGGAELDAARAEWHAMDKTDEREATRRARNLFMSRSALHRDPRNFSTKSESIVVVTPMVVMEEAMDSNVNPS